MRLRDQVIGALNLFRAGPGAVRPGRTCASARRWPTWPPSGLLHERSVRRSETVTEQLQTALNSRVIIEQAKGKLAERLGIDMDRAFSDAARLRPEHATSACPTWPATSSTAPPRDFPPPARRQPHC